jgi:hypothetical protein
MRSLFLSFMLMRIIFSVLNVDVALLSFGLKTSEVTKHVAIRIFLYVRFNLRVLILSCKG